MSRTPLRALLGALVLWAVAARGVAGDTRPQLAELVSDDVGLVVEVRDLAGQIETYLSGPMRRRVGHYPPFEKWAKENGQFWNLFSAESLRRLGASPEDIAAKLLGNEVLFAVWPPDGASRQGEALFLAEAADGQLLETVLDRLVLAHRESGQWKAVHRLEHGGRSLAVHEIETHGDQPRLFLTVADRLGIVATSQRLVRDVLARRTPSGVPRGTLGVLPAYQAAGRRLAPESVVRLFVNPRAWDEALLADLGKKAPDSEEARTQAVVIEAWRATEYLVAGLEFASRFSLEVFMRWDPKALPEAVREVADAAQGRSEFLEQVPLGAIVALVGRVDGSRLLRRFAMPRPRASTGATLPASATSAPPTSRPPEPGLFALLALAGGVGPDFGAYLTPHHEEQHDSPHKAFPCDCVVGLRTRALEPGDGRPALADLLEPFLHSALVVAAEAHNSDPSHSTRAEVRSREVEGRRLTSVVGLVSFPTGLEATYTVVEGRFVAGTSPEAVRRAATLTTDESLAHSPRFNSHLSPRLAKPSQLVYIDLAGLRRLLGASPEAIAFLAAVKGLDRPAAERSGRELLALLQLADALVAAVQVDHDGLVAGVRLIADEDDSP
jgi:hypothetical protein